VHTHREYSLRRLNPLLLGLKREAGRDVLGRGQSLRVEFSLSLWPPFFAAAAAGGEENVACAFSQIVEEEGLYLMPRGTRASNSRRMSSFF